jgi:iron complex outermembrane recepter protein
MPTRIVALPVSIGALIAVSCVAFADPPAPPTSAPASSASSGASGNEGDQTLEEIVVTAEKRNENLEAVPIALSAFTSKERDLIGIETIQDITDFTPGLAYSTVLDRAFIRGVGRETNNLATQPGVATYNDGLYNSSVVAASGDTLFVDHIEVLRGPQGTLWGRNAIGGSINEISKKPTEDWYAEVRTDVANYGVYNFEAALSGPITDNLRFRVAGYRNTQEDGWFRNLALPGKTEGGNGDFFYWEAQLEWTPASNIDFWMKFSQLGYEDTFRTFNTIGQYSYVPGGPGNPLSAGAGYGFLLPTSTALNAAECNNNPGSINIHSFCANTPDSAKLQRDYQVTPQLSWQTPYGFDIKYIGGYTTFLYTLHQDADLTSMQSYVYPGTSTTVFQNNISGYVENQKYWSNEVDFTSQGDSSFQWIAGLYQYAEREDQPLNLADPGQNQLLDPISLTTFKPTPTNVLGDNFYYTDLNIKAHSYAAFTQTDWQFLPTWKLTTGIRYNYDEESGPEQSRIVFFNPGTSPIAFDVTQGNISFAPAPGVVGPPTFDPTTGNWIRQLQASWNAVTGTAGVEWQPTDSTHAYFKYSRGYKAGGFNAGAIVGLPETNPEFINAYEIGVKYTASKFQINQAFFFNDYQGLQIPLAVQPPPPHPAITEVFNIPKVLSYGSESEITFRPTPEWQFLLTYSYLRAYIDTKFSAVNAVVQNLDSPATAATIAGVCAGAVVPGVVCPTTALNGSTVPESAKNKISANTNYTWRFAPGFLNFSTSWVYKSPTYSSIFNTPYNLAPSYTTLDFRTTWTDASDRYTLFLYCHNCANKIAYDGVASGAVVNNAPPVVFGPNSVSTTPGLIPPRQYGIEIQYRPKFK